MKNNDAFFLVDGLMEQEKENRNKVHRQPQMSERMATDPDQNRLIRAARFHKSLGADLSHDTKDPWRIADMEDVTVDTKSCVLDADLLDFGHVIYMWRQSLSSKSSSDSASPYFNWNGISFEKNEKFVGLLKKALAQMSEYDNSCGFNKFGDEHMDTTDKNEIETALVSFETALSTR